MEKSDKVRWPALVEYFHFWFESTNSSKIGQQVEVQQLMLMVAGGPFMVFGVFLGATVFVYLVSQHFGWKTPLHWAAFALVAVVLSLLIVIRLRAGVVPERARRWHRLLGYWALFTGVLWGATSWLFLPAPLGHEREATIVVAAMQCIVAAVGGAGFIYYRPLSVTWIAASLGPGAIGFLRLGDTTNLVIGVGMVGIACILLRFISVINQQVVASLRLALENQALLDDREGLLAQLEERTRSAEKAKEVAEAASVVRMRFLSAASHDLRQPVHVIGLRASELLERIRYPEVRGIVETIVQSTETLEERFDAILGAAQLQMGRTKPNIDAFPLSELLARIESSFGPQAKAEGLQFEVRRSRAIVRTDLNLVTSLVGNFVSNALRYTQRGAVLVRCRERAGTVRIQVWDSGPGIPRSEFKVIFEEFVRLEHAGPAPRERGHGMGLAIVRGLAEALGLRVGVRSRVGRGSLFWVELPLVGHVTDEAGDGSGQSVEDNEKIAGTFVVAIDDEEEVLASHRSLLRLWGCHVVAAPSVEDALGQLESHERIPDLLLCDYQLGNRQTGVEAVRAIRAAQACEIPAILLTGDITVIDQLQTVLPHCTVLTKPLRASKLRPALLQALADLPDAGS